MDKKTRWEYVSGHLTRRLFQLAEQIRSPLYKRINSHNFNNLTYTTEHQLANEFHLTKR